MDKYFDEIRPNLSTQSKKLYGKQLEKVFIYSKMKKFEPLKLTIRIVNQSIKNKNLDMIILEEGGLQSQNQRLSAFRNMLENNEKDIPKIKYDKVSKMITDKGNEIRNEISNIAGKNVKTNDEEINMIPWEKLTEFVENMSDNTKMELRNKLILNLMINNYKVIDNQKYNVLLRVIEYQTLNLWTNKKPPPNDKENYLWLKELPILYIQHSKTIGGVKRVGNESVEQVKLKTFPISKNVIEILKKYIKEFKIKNKNILFFGPDGEVMKNPYFRNILTTELKTLAPNITSTIIRKIYENKEITLKNANDKMIFNKLVDHSMAIAEVFYHKN
tara:strand:- start:3126 stop:4115 length:990 start_codon:yes stop_codon:yes gene_type:complete